MTEYSFHKTLRTSQKAMADLYIWSAVVDLLEGSSTPSAHHHAATAKVIAIAKAQSQKALTRMDEADARLKEAAQRAQQREGQ